jgi:hypothetical protein
MAHKDTHHRRADGVHDLDDGPGVSIEKFPVRGLGGRNFAAPAGVLISGTDNEP